MNVRLTFKHYEAEKWQIKRKLTWKMYANLLKINLIITPWALECLLNKTHLCTLFLAAAGDHNDTTQEDKRKFQHFFMVLLR